MDKKEQLKGLLRSAIALQGAMRDSVSSAKGDHAVVGQYASFKTFMRKYNLLAQESTRLLPSVAMLDAFNLDNVYGSTRYTWPERVFSAALRRSETVTLRDPVMPVLDGLPR
jgi:hypothetical protein